MSMPHPRAIFLAFGAVILVSKSGKHSTLNIFTTSKHIEKLHPALSGLGTIIATNEDLPSSGVYYNPGPPAVIAKKSIKVHKKHKAYMVQKSKKSMPKMPVPAADFEKPMKQGWYYWLEPA